MKVSVSWVEGTALVAVGCAALLTGLLMGSLLGHHQQAKAPMGYDPSTSRYLLTFTVDAGGGAEERVVTRSCPSGLTPVIYTTLSVLPGTKVNDGDKVFDGTSVAVELPTDDAGTTSWTVSGAVAYQNRKESYIQPPRNTVNISGFTSCSSRI